MNENGNIMQSKINEGILKAIESVKTDREKHYETNTTPNLSDVKTIISSCGNKNGIISGGAAIVPGPLGMLTVIPDIVIVTNNQVKMIYDIAKAHSKEEKLSSELIVAILLSSMGSSTIGLLTIYGGKVMAKRVGAQAIQKIIHVLGGKILQKTITTTASRYVPVAGALAMATWTKYATNKIGQKAVEIFSKEIIIEEDFEDIEIVETPNLSFNKILMFINLMKADGIKHNLEVTHIKSLIDDSLLTKEERTKLLKSLVSTDIEEVDYCSLSCNKDESLSLIIDLISLAKADGNMHVSEEMYIKEIAQKLEISEEELELLM